MTIDERATAAARARHVAGVASLNEAFHWDREDAERLKPPKHSRPKARRLARKRAHDSRRRNR